MPRPRRLEAKLAEYKEKYPEDYEELNSIITGKLPEGWADALPTFTPEDAGVATRIHSQTMLNALGTACRASSVAPPTSPPPT